MEQFITIEGYLKDGDRAVDTTRIYNLSQIKGISKSELAEKNTPKGFHAKFVAVVVSSAFDHKLHLTATQFMKVQMDLRPNIVH